MSLMRSESSGSYRKGARPNTTPATFGSRREPTSIRIVKGLGSAHRSEGSMLASHLSRLQEQAEMDSEEDHVVIDEEIESCPPSPEKSKAKKSCANAVTKASCLNESNAPPSAVAKKEEKSKTSSSLKPRDLPVRPSTSVGSSRVRRINLGRKELLGKGSFGMVYRAMDIDTNRILAVKEISIAPGSAASESIGSIRKEIALMEKLDHPNIVKYLGEHLDDQFLRIYMEYVPGGTISSILRSFGPFQDTQASSFTKQMLEGLKYLHERNIVHRDLKGENLLVDTNGTLKLADFGTAKELATEAKSVAGTAYYMSPEVIKGTGHGLASDIWSIGCCVVEMLTGKPPFHKFKNQYAIMIHIAEKADDVSTAIVPSKASDLAKAFITRCLVTDPANRPTCEELLQDPWILSPPEPVSRGAETDRVVEHIERLQTHDGGGAVSIHYPQQQEEKKATKEKPKKKKAREPEVPPPTTTDVKSSIEHKNTFNGSSFNPMQSFSEDL